MDTLYFPTEHDFKRWIKEALKELFEENMHSVSTIKSDEPSLMNRKEIAGFLRVSLVTLNDWMKRGFPSHKQGGKIYFDKKEVLDYIKQRKLRHFKVGSKLHHLKQEIG